MMDIIERLEGLLKQATVERSHYYVGSCCKDAIEEIKMLRERVSELSWRIESGKECCELLFLKKRYSKMRKGSPYVAAIMRREAARRR